MMCSTRLICRFPARDSRWRIWSPEEASIGAVPFQEAKCARVGVLLALVDALQVTAQLRGAAGAGLARGIAGADPGQQRPGLSCRQVLLGAAGNELEQQ